MALGVMMWRVPCGVLHRQTPSQPCQGGVCKGLRPEEKGAPRTSPDPAVGASGVPSGTPIGLSKSLT